MKNVIDLMTFKEEPLKTFIFQKYTDVYVDEWQDVWHLLQKNAGFWIYNLFIFVFLTQQVLSEFYWVYTEFYLPSFLDMHSGRCLHVGMICGLPMFTQHF